MDLIINIDAADKTAAVVASATDLSPVDPLQELVLGDHEPITLQFVDEDGATPAFASDSTYTVAVGLGALTTSGEQLYTSTTSFSLAGSTRSGRLSLDTGDLRSAVYNGMVGNTRRGANLVLQVRVTDPSGYARTYALVNVFVAARVLSTPAPDDPETDPYISLSSFLTGAIHPLTAITALTGGGGTALDGIATAGGALPTGYTALLSYNRIPQTWQLMAGTDAEDTSATPAIVRPDDYNASTNARVWVQLM